MGLETDLKTVNLMTTAHERGNTFTVTVQNIFDRADTPNQVQDKNNASYYFKIVDMQEPELQLAPVPSELTSTWCSSEDMATMAPASRDQRMAS